MKGLTVTVVDRDDYRIRYRAVGEPSHDAWKASRRHGTEPWCEFTVYRGSEYLSSYGGEVWPTAWPEYFASVPPSVAFGCGGVRLTDAGRALLAEIEEVHDGK